eukprot:2376399-Pleurochrysis_carterae.AAC.5
MTKCADAPARRPASVQASALGAPTATTSLDMQKSSLFLPLFLTPSSQCRMPRSADAPRRIRERASPSAGRISPSTRGARTRPSLSAEATICAIYTHIGAY